MALDREKLEEESVIRRFYQIILSWDYFRLLKESKKQKNNGGESGDGDALRLPKVKSQYKDVDEYVSTYEPLIFEEAKSQIIKQNEDEEVTEWKLGVVKSCTEADGFHFIELPCEIKEGESVSQNDLLLLSKEKEGSRKPLALSWTWDAKLTWTLQHNKSEFLNGKKFPTVYAFAWWSTYVDFLRPDFYESDSIWLESFHILIQMMQSLAQDC
ncbi:probable helicase MAGATAMA 3 [Prosopis cineraria]|uniref:probable helicase MAGATAMA 3 n=1 Tax=Prosopis cineraria TaxID=364024 RepID=UPI00240F7697|nr:probable helicase MAGATAMA 3 [Prosopis cineraria]